MQVYKGLDIGSAKISNSEMENIPHHLIDILNFNEDFNVFLFKKYAKEALDIIYRNGNVPIICGGTGFYIQALLYDIEFCNEDNSIIRAELEEKADKMGNEYLFNELKEIDPESALVIHPNNTKRIIRALEFYYLNGKKFSDHNEEEKQKESPYNFCYFVLNDDREVLYNRIDKRVDKMLELGLVDEVKNLYEHGLCTGMTSAEGIGYKQLLPYLEGNISLEDALNNIKTDSRHYAKRQLTWFRREKDTIWLNRDEYNQNSDLLLEKIIKVLKEKEIINE